MRFNSLIIPSTQFLRTVTVEPELTIYSRTTAGSPAFPVNRKTRRVRPSSFNSFEMTVDELYAAKLRDGVNKIASRISIYMDLSL
jgi:hypothetical protein